MESRGPSARPSARPLQEPTPATHALVVSTVFADADAARATGGAAYSYHFVARAFAPLLERFATVVEITRAESRLDHALWRARRRHLEPVHLAFLPLHHIYLTAHAPNVAFPFWEFPDIPDESFGYDPRNNWARIASRLDLILAASTFTREAFARAGVKTPVSVVPVPIDPAYFGVPPWNPRTRVVLGCPAYVLRNPGDDDAPAADDALQTPPLRVRAETLYLNTVKPRLPQRVARGITVLNRALTRTRRTLAETTVSHAPTPELTLSGVVYTAILSPFDLRKNWHDLVSAYLLALRDHDDATLVIKLVTTPDSATAGLNTIIEHYRTFGLQHRCTLALVAEYLSDAQMVELTRGSTFYVNTARAEGCCLPLQSHLAAGRPGIAPRHTALADYFTDALGFVVASHPEPTWWPQDPRRHLTTSWHRLEWQSFHDHFRASYALAKERPEEYARLAARSRAAMLAYASAERVWPRLADALASVFTAPPARTSTSIAQA